MRQVKVATITEEVARLSQESNYYLDQELKDFFIQAKEEEESPTAQAVFAQLLENASIAGEEEVPLCQDTGTTVVFVELGQEVQLVGGNLEEAINEGVSQGYTQGYLRKSMVEDPAGKRKNTGDNTPAIIHSKIVPGDKVKLTIAPKGGGSENMSQIKMLKPADGAAGVKDFVVKTVVEAGPNPCPPVIVGVGIGGNFEKSALLAKEALLLPLNKEGVERDMPELEDEILKEINNSGVGPQGFGGRTTALAVNIKTHPCHIASLPVAVNINCHAARHRSVVL